MKALNECKMTTGTSMSAHVLKMKGHLDQLERLGMLKNVEKSIPMTNDVLMVQKGKGKAKPKFVGKGKEKNQALQT